MRHSPTLFENIALDIIFDWMGESTINRTLNEYIAIAAKLPKLEALHARVNEILATIDGNGPYEICRFKAGDKYFKYEPFPKSLSLETVRTALIKSDMREKGPRRSRKQLISGHL